MNLTDRLRSAAAKIRDGYLEREEIKRLAERPGGVVSSDGRRYTIKWITIDTHEVGKHDRRVLAWDDVTAKKEGKRGKR